MSSVLLHSCCGPCSTYVVRRLQESGFRIVLFWYNPNIHPFREHQRRLESMQAFAQSVGLRLVVEGGYDIIEYFRAVVGHESERCPDCYRLRLSRAASAARRLRLGTFTTTLLISPHQRHETLRAIGEEEAEKSGVDFCYQDFRTGFRESHRLSHELGLYHQGYCGCVYSEWERYGRVKV